MNDIKKLRLIRMARNNFVNLNTEEYPILYRPFKRDFPYHDWTTIDPTFGRKIEDAELEQKYPHAELIRSNNVHFIYPRFHSTAFTHYTVPLHNEISALTHDYPYGALDTNPSIPVHILHYINPADVVNLDAHHPEEDNRRIELQVGRNPESEIRFDFHANPQYYLNHVNEFTQHIGSKLPHILAKRYLANTLRPGKFQNPAMDMLFDGLDAGKFDNYLNVITNGNKENIDTIKGNPFKYGINIGRKILGDLHKNYHNTPEYERPKYFHDFLRNYLDNIINKKDVGRRMFLEAIHDNLKEHDK